MVDEYRVMSQSGSRPELVEVVRWKRCLRPSARVRVEDGYRMIACCERGQERLQAWKSG
jgi:hypothetical protein